MGAKVRYFLDANDQVERMEGVDELVKRLNFTEGAKLKPGMTWDNQALDNVINRILSGARRPLVADTTWLRNMFNEEYFKKKLDPSFLPAKAVQPGDTWNFSGEWLMYAGSLIGVALVRDCAVTFERWEMREERICARLEFRGTEKTKPQLRSKTALRSFFPAQRALFPVWRGSTRNWAGGLKSFRIATSRLPRIK